MYLPRHSDALRKRHTLYAPPKELPLDSDGLFKPLMVLLHQMQPSSLDILSPRDRASHEISIGWCTEVSRLHVCKG